MAGFGNAKLIAHLGDLIRKGEDDDEAEKDGDDDGPAVDELSGEQISVLGEEDCFTSSAGNLRTLGNRFFESFFAELAIEVEVFSDFRLNIRFNFRSTFGRFSGFGNFDFFVLVEDDDFSFMLKPEFVFFLYFLGLDLVFDFSGLPVPPSSSLLHRFSFFGEGNDSPNMLAVSRVSGLFTFGGDEGGEESRDPLFGIGESLSVLYFFFFSLRNSSLVRM